MNVRLSNTHQTRVHPGVSYVLHIAAAPERVWEALTDRETLRKTWGLIESDWRMGSKVREISKTGHLLWTGTVLRSEPPLVLSFTFEGDRAGNPTTEVTFELGAPLTRVTPEAPVTRLSVTHEGFGVHEALRQGCERAWTEILSSLKTYVETGRPINFAWKHLGD